MLMVIAMGLLAWNPAGGGSQDGESGSKGALEKAQGAGDEALLTGRGPYLEGDPGGSGRPRLGGQSLFGEQRDGDLSIRLGGYVDFEYRDMENARPEFRFHRLVPLIESRIGSRIRFQTEIEIEDGEELSVEFAHFDYDLEPRINLRAGVILLPLGRLNLMHDSPLLSLTDRPLVDTYVIPTTLRDAGFGLRGRFAELFAEEGAAELRYEAYLVSGYRGQKADGSGYNLSASSGLRDARPSTEDDGLSPYESNNDSMAFCGRLALRGPGYELGLSAHHGAWDNAGELDLDQFVLDADWSPRALQGLEDHWVGGFRWQAESAWSSIDRDAPAVAGGVPGKADGCYTQLEYFFGAPEDWTAGADPLIERGGGFGLVHRYGRIDLDGATRSRHAVGLFFRPNADRTVIKFEYQWNREGGSTPQEDDDGFVASIATYF